jgi:glycosyltransferase involved in cell wall biosynthesis
MPGLGLMAVGWASGLYVNTANIAKNNGLSGQYPPPYQLEPRFRVSLVVPAYMEEKYIPMLLRSAANQTEPFAEIVVVDSSPPGDPTAEIAAGMGARVIPFQRGYGNIAAARNEGAAQTDGEIIVFCDADVSLSNFFVERAVDALVRGYALAHPREGIYDSNLWNVILWLAQIKRVRLNTTRCVVVPRMVYASVGGYDETCINTDLCREDLVFGAAVAARYGSDSIKVLGPLIATSARRWVKFGFTGLESWRQEQPRSQVVQRVTGRR